MSHAPPPPAPAAAATSDPDGAVLASDDERERAVDLLRAGSAQGRLTVAELEERTDRALSARTRAELERLTLDLPRPAPSAARASGPRRSHEQLAAYLTVCVLLIVVWAATGADYFWPIWPIVGWGIGIAKHGYRGGRRIPSHGPASRPRPR